MNIWTISTKASIATASSKAKTGRELVMYVCQKNKVIPAKKLGATPSNNLRKSLSVFTIHRNGPVQKIQTIKNDIASRRYILSS
ncbi:hypothetical protein [Flavobacterium sp.]|uniref:hypothetical protein n=1 Tax=Flavobacterium sp. TaxID=239 RepID=UPI0025BE1B5A|nr:hypothetical protein [Flavobacterium sp.]